MIWLFNWFTKITGYLVQKLCFRTKVYYEDKKVQSRRIKGAKIIVSNHTSVFDYAVFMFVFYSRTLRYQMAEVLFKKKGLKGLLKCLGGIYINRNAHDYGVIEKSEKILNKGGVVGVFPEGRIAKENEDKPLKFKEGAVYLSLLTGAEIIPVYTNGSYFNKKRARVIIGTPINARDMIDENESEKENVEQITERIREKVIRLGEMLNERTKK